MELEAPPRQTIERAAAAPVERQEAARFAGGCAGDLVTLDDDRQRAASAGKVSDRGADRATAADHDALARAHTATVSGWASRFQGRAHRTARAPTHTYDLRGRGISATSSFLRAWTNNPHSAPQPCLSFRPSEPGLARRARAGIQ